MTGSPRYDVAVIGAGPAGSRTASAAAARGLRVLLLEKRARVGFPVRCAEAVGPRADVERYLPLEPSLVSSPVNGVVVVAPDGSRFETAMPGAGFVVDRERFDARLAAIAVERGAELRTAHQAMGFVRENGRIAGVRVKDLAAGREYEVSAAVVAGADGVESLSPRWAGLKEHSRPEEVFSCAQYTMEGIETPSERIEFHLGTRIAPGGYAWVFPKGAGTANVGIGVNPLKAGGVTALAYLDEFARRRCPEARPMRTVVGGCSVARGMRRLAAEGFVAVGEAANMNNPFSGGGIINALEGADMAAEAIAAALAGPGPTAAALGAYTKRWNSSVGKTNETFYHAARIFYDLPDDRLSAIMRKVIETPGVFDERGVRPLRFTGAIIAASPSLVLRLMRSLIAPRR